nr:HAMP domain-containing sensor histidine kinase [Candidatus Krumholzibacteria bacterium]
MLKPQEPIPPDSSHFVSAESLRLRLDWFNKLRWGAVLGILLAMLVSGVLLRYALPMRPLLITVGVLALLNLIYVWRNRRQAPTAIRGEMRLVKLQMVGDLVALTVLLNLTGGIENPFFYLFVIHVIIASLLFKGREIYQITWLAIALFTTEVLLEYGSIIPHHHLLSASHLAHELPFILATLASFWLVMLFSAYMVASIMKHNRAIKDELVERQAALMAQDKAKTDFFRFVAHEVKSPVNTAQSAVETALELGGAQMKPAIEDMLQRGVRRLEQATEMVKDLADLTRGGMLKPEHQTVVDVTQMVFRVMENQQDMASRRGIKLVLEGDHQPVVVTTNKSMLEKIIHNLISNAVRYNKDKGCVTITLHDERTAIRLAVSDEGIGIAPEDKERIFEEFYRSDAAQRATNLGTGLGLSIVRKFVEEMGGQIELHSVPGEGSRFTLVLPRRATASTEIEGP